MRCALAILGLIVVGCAPPPAEPKSSGPPKATMLNSDEDVKTGIRQWTWRIRFDRPKDLSFRTIAGSGFDLRSSQMTDRVSIGGELEIRAKFSTPYAARPHSVLMEAHISYFPEGEKSPTYQADTTATFGVPSQGAPLYHLNNAWPGGERPIDHDVALVYAAGHTAVWLTPL